MAKIVIKNLFAFCHEMQSHFLITPLFSLKNTLKQPPCEKTKKFQRKIYPEKAGLMELCVSASLHGLNGLREVPELAEQAELRTKH